MGNATACTCERAERHIVVRLQGGLEKLDAFDTRLKDACVRQQPPDALLKKDAGKAAGVFNPEFDLGRVNRQILSRATSRVEVIPSLHDYRASHNLQHATTVRGALSEASRSVGTLTGIPAVEDMAAHTLDGCCRKPTLAKAVKLGSDSMIGHGIIDAQMWHDAVKYRKAISASRQPALVKVPPPHGDATRSHQESLVRPRSRGSLRQNSTLSRGSSGSRQPLEVMPTIWDEDAEGRDEANSVDLQRHMQTSNSFEAVPTKQRVRFAKDIAA
mmetsp:Transcript_52590/g.104360  ORF Transcript_52590/g.104360 Transcript_52590/m.104360 type:complete len:272 (+) Transcript_52590:33-848(+)